MLILAVDTSTRAGSVAVLRDGELVGVRATTPGQAHASSFFIEVQALLDHLAIPMTAFDLFAVAAGPGSFTGLRVGLTAVKAWAEAFDQPIAPVSSLEAIAIQVVGLPDISAESPIVAVQDARRAQVFGNVYEQRSDAGHGLLRPSSDDVLLPAGEFLAFVAEQSGSRRPVFVTPAPEPIQSALRGSPFESAQLEVVSGILAPFVGKLGYARALRGELVDALHLDANYVRRTDAEVKWTDRPA